MWLCGRSHECRRGELNGGGADSRSIGNAAQERSCTVIVSIALLKKRVPSIHGLARRCFRLTIPSFGHRAALCALPCLALPCSRLEPASRARLITAPRARPPGR